jgi:hypothetical protein
MRWHPNRSIELHGRDEKGFLPQFPAQAVWSAWGRKAKNRAALLFDIPSNRAATRGDIPATGSGAASSPDKNQIGLAAVSTLESR